MIKAREKMMRMMQSPKGRNPTPGCLKLPILRCAELHAPITPITKRTYPVIRSHFSMSLFLRLILTLQSIVGLTEMDEPLEGFSSTFWRFIRDADGKQG